MSNGIRIKAKPVKDRRSRLVARLTLGDSMRVMQTAHSFRQYRLRVSGKIRRSKYTFANGVEQFERSVPYGISREGCRLRWRDPGHMAVLAKEAEMYLEPIPLEERQ